ncbi:MAG: hypothetical protein BGO06_12330 [Shinella sp. 65-6]|nr:MAG: hypothetical protein BGO06_12330 [Shinella sp. 65-6]
MAESISFRSASVGSMSALPVAKTSTGSSPSMKRARSKSWMVMSLKMPPDALRYSREARPGSREVMITWRISPISPERAASRAARCPGSYRRLKSIWIGLSKPSSAARQALTLASDRSMGFSQKMALPAFADASMRSACVGVDVAISTASACAMASPALAVTTHPNRLPTSSAAAETGSYTAASSALLERTIVAACIFPIRPQPSNAILIIDFLPMVMQKTLRI